VVVDALDSVRVARPSAEADPPLIVDADALLLGAGTARSLEAVPWRRTQVVKPFGSVERSQLPKRSSLQVRRPSPDRLALEQTLGVSVAKAPNHDGGVTDRDNNGRRY